jgi:membrane-associated protein
VNQIINWVLASVDSIAPIPRTLLAALFIMLETSFLVGLIVPGDTVVLVASTGIQNIPEFIFMIVMVMFGSLVGETIGFFVGKFFGPRIRRSWVGKKLGEHRWEAVENYIDRRGGIAVFLSRFLPVLHSLVPLTVGSTRMSYRTFISWTAAACAIWTGLYVSAAALLKNQYFELAKKYDWAGWAIIGAVIVLMVTVYLVKKRVEKHEARFMDEPGDGDPNTIDDPLGS